MCECGNEGGRWVCECGDEGGGGCVSVAMREGVGV